MIAPKHLITDTIFYIEEHFVSFVYTFDQLLSDFDLFLVLICTNCCKVYESVHPRGATQPISAIDT